MDNKLRPVKNSDTGWFAVKDTETVSRDAAVMMEAIWLLKKYYTPELYGRMPSTQLMCMIEEAQTLLKATVHRITHDSDPNKIKTRR